ncbi:hypothetical protein KUCAC02_032254, partial [Chaenocephalus aceratus]
MMVRAAVLKMKDPRQIIKDMEKLARWSSNPVQQPLLRESSAGQEEEAPRDLRAHRPSVRERKPRDVQGAAEVELDYETKRGQLALYFDSVKNAESVEVDSIPLPDMPHAPSNIHIQDIPLPGAQPPSILRRTRRSEKELCQLDPFCRRCTGCSSVTSGEEAPGPPQDPRPPRCWPCTASPLEELTAQTQSLLFRVWKDSAMELDSEEEREEERDGEMRMSVDRPEEERERDEDRDRTERHAGRSHDVEDGSCGTAGTSTPAGPSDERAPTHGSPPKPSHEAPWPPVWPPTRTTTRCSSLPEASRYPWRNEGSDGTPSQTTTPCTTRYPASSPESRRTPPAPRPPPLLFPPPLNSNVLSAPPNIVQRQKGSGSNQEGPQNNMPPPPPMPMSMRQGGVMQMPPPPPGTSNNNPPGGNPHHAAATIEKRANITSVSASSGGLLASGVGATISAKPQIINMKAEVTRFVPTALRVRRDK